MAPVPPGARSIGGLLSKAWGFITDEAAALEAQADGVVDPALAKAPQPSWGLRLVLQGEPHSGLLEGACCSEESGSLVACRAHVLF